MQILNVYQNTSVSDYCIDWNRDLISTRYGRNFLYFLFLFMIPIWHKLLHIHITLYVHDILQTIYSHAWVESELRANHMWGHVSMKAVWPQFPLVITILGFILWNSPFSSRVVSFYNWSSLSRETSSFWQRLTGLSGRSQKLGTVASLVPEDLAFEELHLLVFVS